MGTDNDWVQPPPPPQQTGWKTLSRPGWGRRATSDRSHIAVFPAIRLFKGPEYLLGREGGFPSLSVSQVH